MELLWTVFSLDSFSLAVTTSLPTPCPPTHPPTTSIFWHKFWCAPSRNYLKWPKIKQVTSFKPYYIKFNVSINTILLNKASVTRVILITTFKTGISTIIPRCELGQFSHGRSHIAEEVVIHATHFPKCYILLRCYLSYYHDN